MLARRMKPSTKDNLTYLTIALLIVAALVFYIFYTERTTGRIQEIAGPVLWGIISTSGIVALLFNQFWAFRRRPLLWAITAVVALLNGTSLILADSVRWNPRVVVWGAITLIWVYIGFFAGEKLFARSRQ